VTPTRTPPVQSATLPDALAHFDDVMGRMADRRPALFLDYDGTLVPLARRPELAVPPEDLRTAIGHLATLMPVAVVSGRGREDVRQMLNVSGIAYAGSHGFDITDAGGRDLSGDVGDPYLPALKQAAASLAKSLDPISGAFIEDKTYSLAIHYREVHPDEHADVHAAVETEAARHDTLKRTGGKMIHELRPDLEWHKGTAVLRVMDALGLTPDTAAPVYLGDDETDEDAFAAVRDTGIGIKVGGGSEPTAAHFHLASPADVRVFLDRVASRFGN